mmetsp:Transcript_36486/g.60013  ORF Transcript_36486/g.60013 Transcript_36486/m.60013 type:complete len:243 (+) Transcript_36486:2424-3152(+)
MHHVHVTIVIVCVWWCTGSLGRCRRRRRRRRADTWCLLRVIRRIVARVLFFVASPLVHRNHTVSLVPPRAVHDSIDVAADIASHSRSVHIQPAIDCVQLQGAFEIIARVQCANFFATLIWWKINRHFSACRVIASLAIVEREIRRVTRINDGTFARVNAVSAPHSALVVNRTKNFCFFTSLFFVAINGAILVLWTLYGAVLEFFFRCDQRKCIQSTQQQYHAQQQEFVRRCRARNSHEERRN